MDCESEPHVGSVLTAQSLEPALDSVSLSLSVSKINKRLKKLKKKFKRKEKSSELQKRK